MTISIRQVLAMLPSGRLGSPLDDNDLSRYLAAHCNTDAEKERNARHTLRDELYRDGGVPAMEAVIDKVFRDPKVRELRKHWVKYARFNNPLKRIVNEQSTVYAEAAERHVGDVGKPDDVQYHAVLEDLEFDEIMLQASRLLNLHRALLIGMRVAQHADGCREPVIDIATPASVRAVLHPNDPKQVVGWIVRNSFRTATVGAPAAARDVPEWTLWTDHERCFLRGDFTVIGDSFVEHGLGVNPWVAVTLGPPFPGFWPGEEGEDLVAASISIWMTNVLLLKESKSATKLSILSGDVTSAARDQSFESESVAEIPDGASMSTIDTSMNLQMFRDTADYILGATGNNYGMPAAVLNHQGVQSADARELMRVPIREIRLHQQKPWRRFEKRFVAVMVAVLKVDLPALAFDPAGWRMLFGESQTPLSRKEALDIFLVERAAGLDSSKKYLQRHMPGLTGDQANAEISSNIEDELERNIMMRPLAAVNGSAAAPNAPAASSAQNGARGPAAAAVTDPAVQQVTQDLADMANDATDSQMKATLRRI